MPASDDSTYAREEVIATTTRTVFPADVTCVLTSCGRWDLLVQSIDTFLAHNQPQRFIVVEDSGDAAFAERLRARYPAIEVVLNTPRLGQHGSIDRAYGMVTTPWIVHLEDDWYFTGPLQLAAARRLLDSDPTVIAVCFSVFRRLKLRHRVWSGTYVHDGKRYADMRRAHRESYGFSYYPTLIRRRTWEEHGPYARFPNERAISKYMKAKGLGIVHELPGVGIHVGRGKSVFDPARAGEKRRITGSLWRRLTGRGRFASPGG
jgi:hypothetical protein